MLKTINDGKTPTLATKYSAAVDLYSNADITIGAGETVKVPLGVCIDLLLIEKFFIEPMNKGLYTNHIKYNTFIKSHYLELHPRSSLRAKGLIAGVGVIDFDFADEIQLIIHNPFNRKNTDVGVEGEMFWNPLEKEIIKKGDRIAQIMLKDHKTYLMGFETETERTGGIGSTND